MPSTPGDLSILRSFNTCKTCSQVTLKLESREISRVMLIIETQFKMIDKNRKQVHVIEDMIITVNITHLHESACVI